MRVIFRFVPKIKFNLAKRPALRGKISLAQLILLCWEMLHCDPIL